MKIPIILHQNDEGFWLAFTPGVSGYVEDAPHTALMSLASRLKPKELWQKLGDIPIDDNECIELPFLHFEIGTFREDIWHWFEDELGVEVRELMYGGKDGY